MREMKTSWRIKGNRRSLRIGFSSLKRIKYWLLTASVGGLFLMPAVAGAATLISQGFVADTKLPPGSVVSLKKESATNVESTTIENVNNIIGIVIDAGSSQLSLSSEKGTQVQVATSGVEQVLVSDINGKITAGDQITASPLSGVGMRATGSTKVVGVAQGDFPNSSASDQKYKDKDNQEHTVKLGQVAVLVSVTYYYKQPDKTIIPSAIQNLANALAGKKVNPLPVILSIIIFIVTLIVVVSIIYSLIHSSIISVGRNPMSQAAVYRNVIQLSALVVVILAVSVISIYMVLRKF